MTKPNQTWPKLDHFLAPWFNLAVTQPQFFCPTVWQSNSPQISDKIATKIFPILTTLAFIITVESAKFEAKSV